MLNKIYTRKNIKMKGGIPIYPGGYSCVFKPQLKCKKQTKKNNRKNKEGISKLLFKKYAKIEVHNIEKFYDALKKIPKSHKYFLFTKTTSCSPAKISAHDLQGFDEMCTNFTSHGIYESNINTEKNIRDLTLINMPNAGISINEWLFLKIKNKNIRLTSFRIKAFNKMISKLILNAIVPMNKQGVIHNDMKEDNVLIYNSKQPESQSQPHPTIIDWGISGISTHDEPIPEIIMNHYISISNPFSSILFSVEFSKNYSEFLKHNEIITRDHVHNMRKDSQFQKRLHDFSLEQYLKNKEYGHYSHIRAFFVHVFNIYSDSKISLDSNIQTPDDLYHTLASNYISDILIHFTEFDERDRIVRFNYVEYFTKIYIFNCDLWGLLFCYSVFFSFQSTYKYEEYVDIELSLYSSFLNSLLSMYMNYIMINGHKKINTHKITTLLKSVPM